jgi:hypothetical protein
MRHGTRGALYGYAFVLVWIIGFMLLPPPLAQTFNTAPTR